MDCNGSLVNFDKNKLHVLLLKTRSLTQNVYFNYSHMRQRPTDLVTGRQSVTCNKRFVFRSLSYINLKLSCHCRNYTRKVAESYCS